MLPRLVALPGTLCPPEVFERLAAALDGEVEVDALSWLTGPGPWDLEAVAGWVAGRFGGPALLCGHSTGGAIALQVAISRPDLVTGLLLIDTGAHMQGHRDVQAIIRRIEQEWGPDLLAAVLDRSFRAPLDAGTRADWLRWAGAVPPEAARDVLVSQAALDLRPSLAGITVPTEVVHGSYDQARSVEDARELAAAIPGAGLTVLPTGHTPVYEAPAEVADVLRRLLARSGTSA